MIFKKEHDVNNNPKRRLEDRIGKQYNAILEGTEIEGTLSTLNSLVIGGKLKGQINSKGIVWILENAEIEGNINAKGLIVEGYVQGNIQCSDSAELRSSARINGEINCAKLAVSKGCSFEGKVKMSGEKIKKFVAKRNNAIKIT